MAPCKLDPEVWWLRFFTVYREIAGAWLAYNVSWYWTFDCLLDCAMLVRFWAPTPDIPIYSTLEPYFNALVRLAVES